MCAKEKHFHLVRPADSVCWYNSHANTLFFALTCLIDCDHPLPLLSVSHQHSPCVFLFPFCVFILSHLLVAVPLYSFVSLSSFIFFFHANCNYFAFCVQSFSHTPPPPSFSSLSVSALNIVSALVLFGS